MTTHPKEKAEELKAARGPEALAAAEREYATALETQDIKQQGYWLDVIEHLKGII